LGLPVSKSVATDAGAMRAVDELSVLDAALSVEMLREGIRAKLIYALGKNETTAGPRDWFVATALAVRDRITDCWMEAGRRTDAAGGKRVYYLSVEFLIGRLLFDGLNNLGLTETARAALATFDVDLDDLRALEPDAALGNGGLGRLAACFMDSMASIALPAYGYGIRYDFGLFRQAIVNGRQREMPEDWLAHGNPWEFQRSDVIYEIRFGGNVEYMTGDGEMPRGIWHPSEFVFAVAYDTPIIGWAGRHANTLRLWSARAQDPIQLDAFNKGDHVGALAARDAAEAISRVLYPSDETLSGQELRLRQEFFFTSASLQDLLRRHLALHGDVRSLADHAAIHLNDTHPAIAVAELMRLLFDVHEISWAEAWRITTSTLNYTNHTLLPEALETWPLSLMNRLLPRHMQIIFLINHLHLKTLPDSMLDPDFLAAISLIDETGERRVRMGHLAFVGARRINGVSALHTELMKKTVFRDLDRIYPGRIVNETNGITFRRWLHTANPGLTRLIVEALSARVLDEPELLRGLEAYADDSGFHAAITKMREGAKEKLSRLSVAAAGVALDRSLLFDVQIKRIHEYKRQLLNILETIGLYLCLCDTPHEDFAPRVKIFAGKAAASYTQAKLIIKLANDVARVVNSDGRVAGRLSVVFLPNYNVSLAEAIVPAADLSEQISTAGMEASGTGNMKLALNGALTIGTLDGANVEISEHVGRDHMFIFGLTSDEVADRRRNGGKGSDEVWRAPLLERVLEALSSGLFSPDEKDRFKPLVDAVLGFDPFMVAADFEAYWQAQRRVDDLWRDPARWHRASVMNIANMGWFSSDRTIRGYAADIWRAAPLR